MSKDWKPKVGDEIWIVNYSTINKGKIVSISGTLIDTFEVEFDLAGSHSRSYVFRIFKTKKAAKAALIEKLEQALEEARKL